MLKIKLFRFGKKGQPRYRIVVAEARSKRGGKYIDLIGTYNPLTQPSETKLNLAKFEDWLKKGAQPTKTVRNLYLKTKNKT